MVKSSILTAGSTRCCRCHHFETQSNHASFWGLPLQTEVSDNSESAHGKFLLVVQCFMYVFNLSCLCLMLAIQHFALYSIERYFETFPGQ